MKTRKIELIVLAEVPADRVSEFCQLARAFGMSLGEHGFRSAGMVTGDVDAGDGEPQDEAAPRSDSSPLN